jgi:hypothetical protein
MSLYIYIYIHYYQAQDVLVELRNQYKGEALANKATRIGTQILDTNPQQSTTKQ